MEGKETRFGIGGSALFSVTSTATSDGAVNSSHDSFTPISASSRYSISRQAKSFSEG